MLAKIPIGHVVQDSYIGNTHILICDDAYRDKTPEQVQGVLDRCAQISLRIQYQNQAESAAAEI